MTQRVQRVQVDDASLSQLRACWASWAEQGAKVAWRSDRVLVAGFQLPDNENLEPMDSWGAVQSRVVQTKRRARRWPREFVEFVKKTHGDGGAARILQQLEALMVADARREVQNFCADNRLNYHYVRKLMQRFNESVYAEDHLVPKMVHAIQEIERAGIIDPTQIDDKTLLRVWSRALDAAALIRIQ